MSQPISQPIGDAAAALEPLRFPLHGSRLIEASAGTGKTFTIAALYVRLVLGHGGEQSFARALTPPEILVVTFTDAATKELRERIRRQLAMAAGYFRVAPEAVEARAPGADLLHDLRADYPPAAWPACARRLQLAAEWMDEAAVSTIHGWCHRMLREHAFDSSSLFTQTLETDLSELLAEAVRDYWRHFMASLDVGTASEVRAWWRGPDDLLGELAALIAHADLLDAGSEPALAVPRARAERQRLLEELKAPWAAWADELKTLLDAAVKAKQVNGRKLQARFYDPWLEELRNWAADPQQVRPELKTGWERLTPTGLAAAWKSDQPPAHPALEAIAVLAAALDALPNARNALVCHAARWVAGHFAAERARRAQMGFDDLLHRLDAALQGQNGIRLATLIREQFPVALIDEFQDTDPVQYRIFDAVYRVAENRPETALILIGDPKQAIYAFRGADIFTYLAARRATAGRLYTLQRNFRSTAAMVAATNHCFAVAESRDSGEGAFLFRGAGDNPLPFLPVTAQGRADALWVGDAVQPALTVWSFPPQEGDRPWSKEAYLTEMAAVCASQMVQLLSAGAGGRAGFVGGNGLRALRPADMAVLVNNRGEADAIRAALAARGVRSVYLSDKDSVLHSPQAAELQLWLAACADPDDAQRLRAALATPTLGLSWGELDTLNHDEQVWEARVLQFRDYRDCWRRQGVLPMLRRLLGDFHVPARLLAETAAGAGERILTDLLHLAELLQQASVLIEGEHALIRHLAETREEASGGGSGDARQIRLESDADLVQVVTVHKSKGLEYSLVFLPFACAFRAARAEDRPLKWHDEAGKLCFALSSEGEVLARVDRERLGEDLRKLYVALTRARYATWLGVAPLRALERGALGYLVGAGEALEPAALESQLLAFGAGCAHIAVVPAPVAPTERFVAGEAARQPGVARTPRRTAREHWWIASYSALRTTQAEPGAVAETPGEDVFRETRAAQAAAEAASAPPARGAADLEGCRLHDFPRGAEVGSFLHELLEWAARQGFADLVKTPGMLREAVARRCGLRGWGRWSVPLSAWLQHFLSAPVRLPEDSSCASPALAELGTISAEMEFWIAAHEVDCARLDALVCAHTLEGRPRPALEPGRLNGMLKGFIDLVFEHAGRYYVADYKSNWLGADDSAYTSAAMRAEILAQRYELQYVLYLFALHRLLKARLPDYDYDRHIGGAVYLFLRGSHAPGGGVHAERPPRALIESLDALFARAAAGEGA